MNVHNIKKVMQLVIEKRIVTSSEIAKIMKISWNTADSYLKELLIEGKVERMIKDGVTLWIKK